ncbi:MAG: hypothetical protein H6821_10465 [Planctomycetaceae bacterium]|nr:hypothetical protein [Planctomycetales bacterium]MCB9874589.1 hypothetical protein [Planctomycetaceae bacterium]MCB9938645.1 hypothetical protein [Planctomycetaceae bacterium]HRX77673.1 hypothetical protein [Pirellulaceae bacterium]
MRYGLLVLLVAFSTWMPAQAEEPTKSETEDSLRSIIERLEKRVSELETQLQQMKQLHEQMYLGNSLIEYVPVVSPKYLDRAGRMRVDQRGIIRDASGKAVGYWGFDLTPVEGVAADVPLR